MRKQINCANNEWSFQWDCCMSNPPPTTITLHLLHIKGMSQNSIFLVQDLAGHWWRELRILIAFLHGLHRRILEVTEPRNFDPAPAWNWFCFHGKTRPTIWYNWIVSVQSIRSFEPYHCWFVSVKEIKRLHHSKIYRWIKTLDIFLLVDFCFMNIFFHSYIDITSPYFHCR